MLRIRAGQDAQYAWPGSNCDIPTCFDPCSGADKALIIAVSSARWQALDGRRKKTGYSLRPRAALVAQWIEYWPPKPGLWVRSPPSAPTIPVILRSHPLRIAHSTLCCPDLPVRRLFRIQRQSARCVRAACVATCSRSVARPRLRFKLRALRVSIAGVGTSMTGHRRVARPIARKPFLFR